MFIPCYMMLSCKMQKSTLDLVKALALGCGSRYYYNIKVTVKICLDVYKRQAGDTPEIRDAWPMDTGL